MSTVDAEALETLRVWPQIEQLLKKKNAAELKMKKKNRAARVEIAVKAVVPVVPLVNADDVPLQAPLELTDPLSSQWRWNSRVRDIRAPNINIALRDGKLFCLIYVLIRDLTT